MTPTIWEFLRDLYEKHGRAVARHIAAETGGQEDRVYEALLSFRLPEEVSQTASPVPPVPPLPLSLPEGESGGSPATTVNTENLQATDVKIIRFYTSECHALFGNKDALKPILLKLGGFRFNSMLSRGKGWIFAVEKLDALTQELDSHNLGHDVEEGTGSQKAAPTAPTGRAELEASTRRVIAINEHGNHEDLQTGLVFKNIEGTVSAYGVQSESGEILPIPTALRQVCEQKGYAIAEVCSNQDSDSDSELDGEQATKDAESESENENESENESDSLENELTDGEEEAIL